MTTLSDLVERTRRHLYTERRDERNRLSGAIDVDDTALTLGFDAGGVAKGATLAIDLEEMHVWDVSGSTVTVARADGGSTAATHADLTTIFVNPKFSAFSIMQALNEELSDLSSPTNGLFDVGTVSLTYSVGTDAYDLTSVTDLIEIIDVTYDANDGSSRWPSIPRSAWQLNRDLPTADFASGLMLTINGYAAAGQSINVVYKKPYTAFTLLTNNVETFAGVHATAHDILPLGAAIRLTAGAEVARNFLDQGDTRRANEVPAQSRGSEMRALAALRRDRISAEKARLYAKYPVRR